MTASEIDNATVAMFISELPHLAPVRIPRRARATPPTRLAPVAEPDADAEAERRAEACAWQATFNHLYPHQAQAVHQ